MKNRLRKTNTVYWKVGEHTHVWRYAIGEEGHIAKWVKGLANKLSSEGNEVAYYECGRVLKEMQRVKEQCEVKA